MSNSARKMKRAKEAADHKAAKKHYRENRELGACFLNEKEDCQNNGDLKTHCRFCDFVVQACTDHQVLGRNKVKHHLYLKHPTKTLPAVMLGVIRGQSLE